MDDVLQNGDQVRPWPWGWCDHCPEGGASTVSRWCGLAEGNRLCMEVEYYGIIQIGTPAQALTVSDALVAHCEHPHTGRDPALGTVCVCVCYYYIW